MDGARPELRVQADRGGIAAGRDVNLQCDLRICPACELRLIHRDRDRCAHCSRSEHVARMRRDALLAFLGWLVCVIISWQLATAGRTVATVTMAFGLSLAFFVAGAVAYWHALTWARRDGRRVIRQVLLGLLRRVD